MSRMRPGWDVVLQVGRQIRAGPLRFGLSLAAITTALTLVLLFEGFRSGLYDQLRRVSAGLPVDLVITQEGVENMAGARSVLPQAVRAEVEAIEGVAVAHPLTGIPLIYTGEGERTSPIMVVAYDGAGGPQALLEGHAPRGEREIVLDRSLAMTFGLATGDRVDIVGTEFELVGIADGAAAMFTPFVFARYDDLVTAYVEGAFEEAPISPPILGYLLVELAPRADLETTRAAVLATVDGVEAWTPAEVAQADLAMGRRMMDPVMGLLVGVAYAMAILVIGLTTYASVLDRQRDYGIMKAIGVPTWRLAALVGLESLLLCLLALVGGAGLSAVAALAIEVVAPQFEVVPLDGAILLRSLVGAVLVALLGVVAPVFRIHRVDPALVFRS